MNQHKNQTHFMETEKIISNLKSRIGTTSLSDRTLNDYVNVNLPAEGTEPDEAYFKRHSEVLKSLSGNFNKDVAERVDEFKKNYKPQSSDTSAGTSNVAKDGIEDRLKALEDTYNSKLMEMQKHLEEKDKEAAQRNYMREVENAFTKQLEDNGVIFDKAYFENITLKHGAYDTKKSVSDTVKEISGAYDDMFKANNRQTSNKQFSSGFIVQPTGNDDANALREAYKKSLIEQGLLPEPEAAK
jgi:hypothetical protein